MTLITSAAILNYAIICIMHTNVMKMSALTATLLYGVGHVPVQATQVDGIRSGLEQQEREQKCWPIQASLVHGQWHGGGHLAAGFRT